MENTYDTEGKENCIPLNDELGFTVEVLFDVPVTYLLNAKDYVDAMVKVRDKIGYNPGVPVRVTETPINENQSRTFYGGLIFEKRAND